MFTELSTALGTGDKSMNNTEIPAHRERTFLHEVIEKTFIFGRTHSQKNGMFCVIDVLVSWHCRFYEE